MAANRKGLIDRAIEIFLWLFAVMILAMLALAFLIGLGKGDAICPYTGPAEAAQMALKALSGQKKFKNTGVKLNSLEVKIVNTTNDPEIGVTWVVDFVEKGSGRPFANMVLAEQLCDIGTAYYSDNQ